MHTRKRFNIFCLLFFLAITPSAVSAATISFRATPERVGVGDVVRIDVLLDSTVLVNAFSGSVSYTAMFELVAVSDGNSLVNLWIARPVLPPRGASIGFAGITPGGFSGDDGILFSVLFRAMAQGAALVSLSDVEVLRNDGAGGVEPTTVRALTLSLVPESLGGYAEPDDTIPPELFEISLGGDVELFDGLAYAVFTSADKGSGIDRYEVAESRVPSFLLRFFPFRWRAATSPYELSDQRLTSAIYVKAVDRAGNERVSVFPPQHLFTQYENIVLLVILIGVVLLLRIRRARGWGRRL